MASTLAMIGWQNKRKVMGPSMRPTSMSHARAKKSMSIGDASESRSRRLHRMPTMRAAVLASAPGGLHVEQIPVPEPRAGEVLVRVSACGVCHTDLHVMKAEVAFPTPAVMG